MPHDTCNRALEFAAAAAREHRQRLDALADPGLRTVAGWKLSGYGVEDIARALGRDVGSVRRKLHAIKVLWRQLG